LFFIQKQIPREVYNIKGYLFRAVTNHVINANLKRKKYTDRIRRYAEMHEEIANNGPEKALIEDGEINKMFRLIKGWLPRSEAQVIILRYKHNYNIKEVAKKMKVNNRSVSRYISGGLNKVRQFLILKQGD
jgi:RNA polymerase sigma factor (sigma-70 family)